jgi:protein-tyrosine phosphatase
MATSILFVCTANICRSPTAEGVFRAMADKAGLGAAFELDSAGTGATHVGEPPSPPAVEVAAARGYDIGGIRARQITGEDIEKFDHVLAMTRGHLVEMRWLAPRDLADKPKLLLSYGPQLGILDVPDPYGRERADYERAIDLIEVGCRGLLDRLAPQIRKAI